MPDRMTIILADDDEDDRLLALEALKETGLRANLLTVGDGVELLACLKKRAASSESSPVLVLLDLNMPRMGGHEALAAIKQDPALQSIPVVILTTSKTEEDIYRGYDLGANSFVTKPKSFGALVETMKHFSRYWSETVKLPTLS